MKCFIIAAQTVDGFIAQQVDQASTAWTSGADKQWFSERTKKAGVVVMGSTTFQTIGRPLPGRLTVVYSRNEEKYAAYDPSQVLVTQLSPQELLRSMEDKGYSEVAICGGASIYSMFIKAGVVTDIYLTIEPVIFGQGISLFSEANTRNLVLKEQEKIGDNSLLLHYEVLPDSNLA